MSREIPSAQVDRIKDRDAALERLLEVVDRVVNTTFHPEFDQDDAYDMVEPLQAAVAEYRWWAELAAVPDWKPPRQPQGRGRARV